MPATLAACAACRRAARALHRSHTRASPAAVFNPLDSEIDLDDQKGNIVSVSAPAAWLCPALLGTACLPAPRPARLRLRLPAARPPARVGRLLSARAAAGQPHPHNAVCLRQLQGWGFDDIQEWNAFLKDHPDFFKCGCAGRVCTGSCKPFDDAFAAAQRVPPHPSLGPRPADANTAILVLLQDVSCFDLSDGKIVDLNDSNLASANVSPLVPLPRVPRMPHLPCARPALRCNPVPRLAATS